MLDTSKLENDKNLFKSVAQGTISLLDFDTLMLKDETKALECGSHLNNFLDDNNLEDTSLTDSIFEDLNSFATASVLTYKEVHNLCKSLYHNYEEFLEGVR